MKITKALIVALIVAFAASSCGSGEAPSDPEGRDDTAQKEEKAEKETPEHDEESLKELAKEGLVALKTTDVEKVKELVERNMSFYVDEDYVKDIAGRIPDWDGEIRGIKFKTDTRDGRPLAVVHIDDVDEETIQVHYLDYFNEGWNILGGAFGIHNISREEYKSYEDRLEAVMD